MTTGPELIAEAEKFIGVPYKWGGTTPNGFDCSGFTQYVYHQLGITLPRTSQEQYKATERIDASQLQAGDLVFSEMANDGPGHVAMYVGTQNQNTVAGARFGLSTPMVIEAPHTGDRVKYLPMSQVGATSYGRAKGTSVATDGQGGSDITNALGSLFSFPSQIIDYAKQATDNATKAMEWFDAFFQPSTYVRLGAGSIGIVFLIAGLATLLFAGQTS